MPRKPYSNSRRLSSAEITGLCVFAIIGIAALVCALVGGGINETSPTPKPLSPAMEKITTSPNSKVTSATKNKFDTSTIKKSHRKKSKAKKARQNPKPRSRDYIDE